MQDVEFSPETVAEFLDWDNTKRYPTPDEIIDAFEKGAQKGHDAKLNAIREKHFDNLKLAVDLSKEAFESLNDDLSMGCSIFLVNLSTFGDYDIIFVVDEQKYLTDTRKNAYQYLREIKKENNKNTFKLSFSLIPHSESLDFNALSSDGYIIRYERS